MSGFPPPPKASASLADRLRSPEGRATASLAVASAEAEARDAREGGSRTSDAPQVVSGFGGTSPWNASDLPAAAALLQAAYSAQGGRHFAPDGTFDAWFKYTRGIVEQGGCGTLDLSATRCVRGDRDLEALALVTAIAPETAHLAQLAVRPDCRGRGLAARLVQDAIGSAARAGKTALTLLVGEHNEAARRLYASTGFEERGSFVAARRDPG
jgi:ribosomal protein S18 acetylase RimI-like enzyme